MKKAGVDQTPLWIDTVYFILKVQIKVLEISVPLVPGLLSGNYRLQIMQAYSSLTEYRHKNRFSILKTK